MSISIEEIKEASCGRDPDGQSKAITIIGAHNYSMTDELADPEVIAEFSSLEPEVSMAINNDIAWISLTFNSDKSSDLALYFRTLERYLEEVGKSHPDKSPVSFLSIIPVDFTGQYYINAIHPIMWAVEPESIGSDFRILRIAYFAENIAFLESNLDEGFFDEALRSAKEENKEEFVAVNAKEYADLDRDAYFNNSDRFFADKNIEEDDDDDDEYADDGYDDDDDDEDGSDRSSYIYH